MKIVNKNIFLRILTVLGAALIVLSILFLIINVINQNKNDKNAFSLAQKIDNMLPEYKDAFPLEFSVKTMPSIELENEDYIGTIKVFGIAENKDFSLELPIASQWDKKKVSSFPCRLSGSVYTSDLILGGSDSKGQLGFLKNLTIGDNIYLTDTLANRYSYVVTDIITSKDVSTEYLKSFNTDFTLFSRNTFSLDYSIVLLKHKNK